MPVRVKSPPPAISTAVPSSPAKIAMEPLFVKKASTPTIAAASASPNLLQQTLEKMQKSGENCFEALRKLAATVQASNENAFIPDLKAMVEAAKQFSIVCAVDDTHKVELETLLGRLSKLGQLAKKIVMEHEGSLKPQYANISNVMSEEQQRIWRSALVVQKASKTHI
jgi:hypothetical protein